MSEDFGVRMYPLSRSPMNGQRTHDLGTGCEKDYPEYRWKFAWIYSDNNKSLPASGRSGYGLNIGMILDPTGVITGTYILYCATSKLKIKECATTFPSRTTFRKAI